MAETVTMRVYEGDRERIKQMADARGVKSADVVADLLREPVYVCPECGDPFDPAEIDLSTVREHGVFTTGVDRLVKGQRDVKDFECPCCEARISPEDMDAVDGHHDGKATRENLGVTSETDEADESAEEA